MSFVHIAHLTKRFGGHTAVGDVSFDVPEGSTLALLGPSGCGKTTILRCLAGLETPDAGIIEIGGNGVFDKVRGIDLMPEKRELGIVFQSYAVWPHMTVADNVAFPLKVRGMATTERMRLAGKMLETVGLAGFESRSATLVSGGQQLRIPLARAPVHEPRLVLFDEALCNLDAQLREQMRLELRLLQERLGFTAIYVTHDQAEAFGLADTVVLMNHGTIETSGPAREVFRRPASAFVARVFGLNVQEARVIGPAPGTDCVDVALNERFTVRGVIGDGLDTTPGRTVLACIRKESVRADRASMAGAVPGTIEAMSFLGVAEEYIVDVDGVSLRATQPAAGFRRGPSHGFVSSCQNLRTVPPRMRRNHKVQDQALFQLTTPMAASPQLAQPIRTTRPDPGGPNDNGGKAMKVRNPRAVLFCALTLAAAAKPAAVQAQDPPAVLEADPADRDAIRATIAAAKTEGAISYWDAVIQPETNDEMVPAFRKAYGLPPGFAVKHTLSPTLGVVTRVEQEVGSGNVTIDLACLASAPWVNGLVAAGHILRYDTPEAKHYDKAYAAGLGKKGYYTPNGAYMFVSAWNPDVRDFKGKSWRDILNAVPAGRISINDAPNSATGCCPIWGCGRSWASTTSRP